MLLSNCMFGGMRNKRSLFITNLDGAEALNKLCQASAGSPCSRTGLPHASWEPEVANGIVIRYPSTAEAQYPRELCEAWAELIVNFGMGKPGDKFLEIFCGRRAPLTVAVARRLEEEIVDQSEGQRKVDQKLAPKDTHQTKWLGLGL